MYTGPPTRPITGWKITLKISRELSQLGEGGGRLLKALITSPIGTYMTKFGAVETPDPSVSGPAQDVGGKKAKTQTRLRKPAKESLVEEKQVCLGGRY